MCQAGGEKSVLLAARFFHPGRRPTWACPAAGPLGACPCPAAAKTACDWVASLICGRARGGMGCPITSVSWQNAAERGCGHQTCHPIARGFWREGPRAERGEGQTPNRPRFVAASGLGQPASCGSSGLERPRLAATPATSRPACGGLLASRETLLEGTVKRVAVDERAGHPEACDAVRRGVVCLSCRGNQVVVSK